MRPGVGLMGLVGLGLALGAAAPARAWTEANVEAVVAHVDVDESGRARVGLELTVRIHGGWLEGLDLEGLDPDMALIEEKPPSAVSVDDPSQKWRLTARPRDDGGIRLTFPRRASPRRGRIRITLAYTTDLSGRGAVPIEDEQVRISWTLPGWRSGLESVVVALTTPARASASATMLEGPDAAEEITQHEGGPTTSHVFRRLHLPRTMPWTVSVNLPAEQMAPALRGPQMVRPEADAEPVDRESGAPLVPILFLALPLLAALGSRLSFDAAARRRRLLPRPVLPGPGWLAVPATLGLGALAYRAAYSEPVLAIGLVAAGTALCLQRTPRPIAASDGRDLSRVSPGDLRGARRSERRARFLGSPLLDLTTLGGAGLFLSMAIAAVMLGGPAAGDALPPATGGLFILLALPFVLATRMHLPPTTAARLLRLQAVARGLEDIGPAALCLVCSPTDARLQVALATPPPGLLRYEVVVVDSPSLGGFESTLGLLIVADRASDLGRQLECLEVGGAPRQLLDHGDRRVCLVPLGDAAGARLSLTSTALGRELTADTPISNPGLRAAA